MASRSHRLFLGASCQSHLSSSSKILKDQDYFHKLEMHRCTTISDSPALSVASLQRRQRLYLNRVGTKISRMLWNELRVGGCEGWRRHSSLIFLILLLTKPNIEVSGWLYQTKTHFTHIVYQPFSRVSPPSFTLFILVYDQANGAEEFIIECSVLR